MSSISKPKVIEKPETYNKNKYYNEKDKSSGCDWIIYLDLLLKEGSND
jgi:hypothetical protein